MIGPIILYTSNSSKKYFVPSCGPQECIPISNCKTVHSQLIFSNCRYLKYKLEYKRPSPQQRWFCLQDTFPLNNDTTCAWLSFSIEKLGGTNNTARQWLVSNSHCKMLHTTKSKASIINSSSHMAD